MFVQELAIKYDPYITSFWEQMEKAHQKLLESALKGVNLSAYVIFYL